MSHFLVFLLWVIAATGSHDVCEAVAVSASADATVCAAPPPPEKVPSPNRDSKAVPQHRRISNGF